MFIPQNRTWCARGSLIGRAANELVALALIVLPGGLGVLLGGCGGSGSGSTVQTQTPTAATPTFSPIGGSYMAAQSVTISDSTSGAKIYYTTDGSTPTTSSTLYSTPITVSSSETVQAIAVASGYVDSDVASAAYVINQPQTATPTNSLAAGTYTGPQQDTLSDTTPNAKIYYTTDGATPTTSSTLYSAPITVSSSETVQSIAVASGYSNSNVASAAYVINPLPQAAPPVNSLAAGTYTGSQTDTLSDTTPNAKIYYTTDGSTPTTSSTPYTAPVTVASSETVQSIAVASGYTDSNVASAAYVINPASTNPAQNIFSNIAATFNGPPTSGGRVVVYDTLNNNTTTLGNNVVADFTNPSSADGYFGYTPLFIGGSYISVSSTAVTEPRFIVDTAATGQSSPVVISSYVETITINSSAGTAVPTVQATNFVPLPFTNSGGTPTAYGANTGANIAVCLSNNTEAGFIPVSSGSTLGAYVAANPPVAPAVGQDCSGMWIDSNRNVGVISGTGANAVLNMYDSQGNWLLSAPGAVVSLNGSNGSALTAISSSTNVQNSISVSSSLSQSLNLYYLQGGNLESVLIQPGTDGAKPTVTTNSVPNPNGGSLSSVTLIAGTQTSPGIPTSLGMLTGSTLFTLSVTPAAQGLDFVETGNAVLPFTSGIMLGQTSAAYFASSTSSSQPGFYAVQKLAGGGLDSPTLVGQYITGPTGIVVDNNGNVSSLGVGGVANFLSNGTYAGGTTFEDVPPNGGAIFTVSPTSGVGVNFTNSTSSSNNGVAAAQFK